jgi:hypothetical protein
LRKTFAILLVAAIFVFVASQITLFVVPPIGAIPEGGTLVILRLNQGKFIDSADAMCVRIQNRVNLLCRGMVLATVANNATVLMRLPYSRTLYGISTGGVEYGNPPEAEPTAR